VTTRTAKDRPTPPRVSPPDLPRELEAGGPLGRGADAFQQAFEGWCGSLDAAHSRVAECTVTGAALDRLDLTGASLVDVAFSGTRTTELLGRGLTATRVLVEGGRIGTMDLADADLDSVVLRGVRIDYLSLAGARVSDAIIADCTIGTLDLPSATLTRVRFESTTADEVDSRDLRGGDVDLRGLDAAHFTSALSLRGTTVAAHQLIALAPALARESGIDVR